MIIKNMNNLQAQSWKNNRNAVKCIECIADKKVMLWLHYFRIGRAQEGNREHKLTATSFNSNIKSASSSSWWKHQKIWGKKFYLFDVFPFARSIFLASLMLSFMGLKIIKPCMQLDLDKYEEMLMIFTALNLGTQNGTYR